jgi:hypothetical protein
MLAPTKGLSKRLGRVGGVTKGMARTDRNHTLNLLFPPIFLGCQIQAITHAIFDPTARVENGYYAHESGPGNDIYEGPTSRFIKGHNGWYLGDEASVRHTNKWWSRAPVPVEHYGQYRRKRDGTWIGYDWHYWNRTESGRIDFMRDTLYRQGSYDDTKQGIRYYLMGECDPQPYISSAVDKLGTTRIDLAQDAYLESFDHYYRRDPVNEGTAHFSLAQKQWLTGERKGSWQHLVEKLTWHIGSVWSPSNLPNREMWSYCAQYAIMTLNLRSLRYMKELTEGAVPESVWTVQGTDDPVFRHSRLPHKVRQITTSPEYTPEAMLLRMLGLV